MSFRLQVRMLLLATAMTSALPQAKSDQPQLTTSHDEDGVTVLEDGAPVLSYQSKPRSHEGGWERAGYLHPVYNLNGDIITEDFPEDHRHHRGIFWAWHQVWVGEKRLGDAWACQDFRWDVQSVEAVNSGDAVVITAVVHWSSPDFVDANQEPIAVVQERSQIMVHAARPHYRLLDFRLSFRALVGGVRIGGSEDEKGYGGFSPRIQMTGNEQFISEKQLLEPSTTAIDAGTWINITREGSGLAILVHRDNPGVTSQQAKWILRRRGSMQNAVFPGREPVALSTKDPTILRYQLVIHDGSLSPETVRELENDFWQSTQ